MRVGRRAARHLHSLASGLALSLGVWASAAQAQLRLEPSDHRFWIGAGVLVAGAAAVDENVRAYAARHHRESLDDLADIVDPLGRSRYLVPALAGTYLVTRLADDRQWSDVVLHISLAYLAADIVTGVLKPVVGRHRPDTTGEPWRFHPLSTGREWHSFPSGHTTHAFAIAAAIAEEAHRPWVSAVSYGVAALVGVQRVYTEAHWSSDVVASAVLAMAVSKTTVGWLHRDGSRRNHSHRGLRVMVSPNAVLLSVPLVWRPPGFNDQLALRGPNH